MALQLQLENGSLIGGGGAVFKGANVHAKPLDCGSFGHYRLSTIVQLVAGQGSNSRLFELRNSGSNWIIPTEIKVSVMPYGAVAVPNLMYVAMHTCTSFTVVDTASTATPVAAAMKTGMPAAPGGVQIRTVALAGNAAGMTGGTLTESSSWVDVLMAWAASVTPNTQPISKDFAANIMRGGHPWIFAANEGFTVRHATTGSGTTNQLVVQFDVAWAEVPVGGF